MMVVYDSILLIFTNKSIWGYDYKLDKWFQNNKVIAMSLQEANRFDVDGNYLQTISPLLLRDRAVPVILFQLSQKCQN